MLWTLNSASTITYSRSPDFTCKALAIVGGGISQAPELAGGRGARLFLTFSLCRSDFLIMFMTTC